MGKRPSWGVVSTVSEPDPLVLAFVAHHLDLGAAEVTVYFDTPAPALAAQVDRLPGCRAIERPAAYWIRAGRRMPPVPADRQRHNAGEAYARSKVDWLAHVDADEYLFGTERVLSRLASLDDDVDYFSVRPLERVWIVGEPDEGIFDGVFRRVAPSAIPDSALEEIYGPSSRFLRRGISGNGKPKSFYRTGRGLFVGVHDPSEGVGPPAKGAKHKTEAILHFDGLTRTHMVAKLRRRIGQYRAWRHGPPTARKAQMQAVADHAADGAWLQDFVASMQVLDARQVQALTELNLLVRHPFDPSPALRRWFPDLDVDLGTSHFDTLALDELRQPLVWRTLASLRASGRALVGRLSR